MQSTVWGGGGYRRNTPHSLPWVRDGEKRASRSKKNDGEGQGSNISDDGSAVSGFTPDAADPLRALAPYMHFFLAYAAIILTAFFSQCGHTSPNAPSWQRRTPSGDFGVSDSGHGYRNQIVRVEGQRCQEHLRLSFSRGAWVLF